ncbi:PREDICTED: dolichol-phosphate mannosyltransferase subunit 3 [Nicrophorus vespilloides]|uniref:Dolichol-phosphate mannosyltransferase subunit 3 n=1 Tax=Nicrophorus vespilloides TaxID=110193 RepID=A0ABM1N575_NICVS|nr:PREDICTED: dolichol-phosphate mannosyltransferase subunit 3 [Nicrophorus vespilloides]
MTKLMEWLSVLSVLISVWISCFTNRYKFEILDQYKEFILYLPFILIALFGLYAVAVVLYRVFTFNNCVEAAAEVQKQIIEAKEDLAKKGFVFKTS